MASIYLKSGTWFVQFVHDGRRVQRSLKTKDEGEARKMLRDLSRRLQAGESVSSGPLTVRAWAQKWLQARSSLRSYKNDEVAVRLHVLPHIGSLKLADVRVSTLIALAATWRASGRAPKTIRNIYATVQAMFRDALRHDLLDLNPCVLDKRDLGEVVDKDPEWRSTALFERGEVQQLLTDERIPRDRQVFYAIAALAGMRHGETAGRRWRHYHPERKPLGCLEISTSYEGRTKTKKVRYMPVHPALAAVLAEWRLHGWEAMMGRQPSPDDLIIPFPPDEPGQYGRPHPRAGGMRSHHDAYKRLVNKDLPALGLRHRRAHDFRRSFISWARNDGADRDILERATHGRRGRGAIDDYTTIEWETLCREVGKLRLELPTPGAEIIPLRPERPQCPHCGQMMPTQQEKTA